MRTQTYRNYSQQNAVINMMALENMLDEIDNSFLDISQKEYYRSSLTSRTMPGDTDSWSEIKGPQIETHEVFANIENLSNKIIGIIGEYGVRRFETFKHYQDGWDGVNGAPLSKRSTAVMEYFLYKFSNFDTEPSLFLTRNGNLQLGWEDKNGQLIELEFFPSRIEFYIEALDTEGQINLNEQDVNKLISMLNLTE